MSDALSRLVDRHVDGAVRAWWRARARASFERSAFLGVFAGAGRRLGRAPVIPMEGELQGPEGPMVQSYTGRAVHELGRAVLLLDALEVLPSDEHQALIAECYRQGGLEEQIAILRALPWLPEPARFLTVAAEGVRTNAVAILEAIACDNPFPAQHFDTPAWNQLVMKVVFNGLALARVIGLAARRNAELARMAEDFAAERRAAGRPVPEDLALVRLP